MSNRVEELESQVAELQAAVDGLTEELVETRERLRQLEEGEGVDNSRTPGRRDSPHADVEHADSEPAPETETADETEAETETEAEDDDGSDSDGNDIIVA
ncbi:DUF7518 family protein [Haloplanus natans]|uniref:DUF7518 family protein n=1 Tax=Haloplanus natans TaxID=376171 RepID=UPI000677BFEB|nr:hypothetical protein [Haloplanus natans]